MKTNENPAQSGTRFPVNRLSPQSITVRPDAEGGFSIKIGNWATAKRAVDADTQHLTVLSHMSRVIQEEAGPYLALEAHSQADSDSVYLDIFSLGAIAYLLFTGKPPADNDLELQDKLSRGIGLQITDALNGAGKELQDLIQYATHPGIGSRIGSVTELLEYLYLVEDEITRPDTQRQDNPTEARPGDTFDGGILVTKRLGRGASSVAFVVQHRGQERVLKLAADVEHNKRLRVEGETLHKLRHQSIIAYHETPELIGHTGLILDYAVEGTLPPLIEGALEIDPSIFDPGVPDAMAGFCRKALAREVKARFGNAEDMRRAWRQIFLQAQKATRHPAETTETDRCSVSEARLDTQIGLLPLTAQALDTLSRLNINTVDALMRLPRNELVRMTGVGTQTRRELSELIAQLQARLGGQPADVPRAGGDGLHVSVDQLFSGIMPKVTKATDQARHRFLNEYLGRFDSDSPKGSHNCHWPTLVTLGAEIGMDTANARDLQSRVHAQWGKNKFTHSNAFCGRKFITQLRHDITEMLGDQGGVMTAMELAEITLLRWGSVQPTPLRERWTQAVVRAAVETELMRQESHWILRRCGKRILIADNTEGRGEELADYAEALGQLADECAEQQPLLSPVRALERIRAVAAPDSFAGLSNHRLLRLAAAASQGAALSSRAELYLRGMPAERSIELAQGALLGTRVLSVDEVRARIHGRYPEAQPLPGRPALDALMQGLDLGFAWDGSFERGGQRGAYCLPQAGLTSFASPTHASVHYTQHEAGDTSAMREIEQFTRTVKTGRWC